MSNKVTSTSDTPYASGSDRTSKIFQAAKAEKMMRRATMFCVLATLSTAPAFTQQKQLPEGPGKETLQRVCGACHGAEIVIGRGLTQDGWTEIVSNMIARGAQGSEDDFAQIVDYLAKNFPPQSEGAKSGTAQANSSKKVNVNKASADELKKGLDISSKDAGAIVAYRQKNGDFKTIDDIKKVPGVDAGKIEAAKDRLAF
jgi:competence protein ComEA